MAQKAPVMTKLSQHENGAKYSVTGKWKKSEEKPQYKASVGSYNTIGAYVLSSEKKLSRACSFSTAQRFPNYERLASKAPPGPGKYDNAKSTLGGASAPFGTGPLGISLGKKGSEKEPGPGQYEVRDKNRKMEPTLSTINPVFSLLNMEILKERDMREGKQIPAPNKYNPKRTSLWKGENSQTQYRDPKGVKFGTSQRPDICPVRTKDIPGPKYNLPDTIKGNVTMSSGAAYSLQFRNYAMGPVGDAGKANCPPFIPQPTQWG